MNRYAAGVCVALLVATGCSNDDAGSRASAGLPTTEAVPTSAAPAIPTTTASVASSIAPVATSSLATTPATTGTTSPTPTSAVASGPAAAEAGGWRLVVSQPTARATIPPVAAVCYQATGTSREPELELEVTALPPGTTVRVGVAVGRGTARIDLTAAGAGPRDLRIQLVVNGQRIDGLAVTIPVTIAAGAPAATC